MKPFPYQQYQNNGNFQVEKVDGNFIVQIRLNCEN